MDSDIKFNLLKPVEIPKSSWDRIYEFIMTRARFVLLVIEIIIIVLFFAKVVIDTTEKNSRQAFEEIQFDLRALELNYDAEFRELQARQTDYFKLVDRTSDYSSVLTEIFSYVPNPSFNFSIRIDGKNLTILGYDNLNDLRNLENRMKASPSFRDVAINLNLEQRDIESGLGQYVLNAIII